MTKSFAAALEVERNDTTEQAVSSTLDALDHVLSCFQIISRYIQLTMPMVEDGGNFGVTIQLAAAKLIKESGETLQKNMDELFKYHSSRADALEKLKLPSSSTTKSTTASSSSSQGKDGEKGDVSSNSESKSTEEKSTETSTTVIERALRQQALCSVDIKYYNLSKTTYYETITAFMTVCDFMDKNKVKLDKPKGDSGSRGYSSSMY